MLIPEIGEIYGFDYPIENVVPANPAGRRIIKTTWREVLIESVRDLTEDPLDIADFIRRPYVQRGAILITGIEQATRTRKSFYPDWHSPVEFQTSLPGKRPIRSGPSRIERSCFADICQQLVNQGGKLEVWIPGKRAA